MRKRGLLKNFTGSLLYYKVISQSFFSEICIIELFKNFLPNLKLFFSPQYPYSVHVAEYDDYSRNTENTDYKEQEE